MLLISISVAAVVVVLGMATGWRHVQPQRLRASAAALDKRLDVSWGPVCLFQQGSSEIVSTVSTFYPGKMPANQEGYMFSWIGISVHNGDLVQSIVGSYPSGKSECMGQAGADETWCVSSEVYRVEASGKTTQYVGSKTTAVRGFDNGIIVNYTLADRVTHVWVQTMTDAVTGELLSTFTKESSALTQWMAAIELQPDDSSGAAALGTVESQYLVKTSIVLTDADPNYGAGITCTSGAVSTGPITLDGGTTWFVDRITLPAMQ